MFFQFNSLSRILNCLVKRMSELPNLENFLNSNSIKCGNYIKKVLFNNLNNLNTEILNKLNDNNSNNNNNENNNNNNKPNENKAFKNNKNIQNPISPNSSLLFFFVNSIFFF